MPAPFVAPLSHNALLSISGDDAATFLHGQFTNDVQALHPGEAQWNGWCSAKGRLLATFALVRHAEGFFMVLPAELAAPIAKRLGMFVLRARVKIADVTATHDLHGVGGGREVDGMVRLGGVGLVIAPKGAAVTADAPSSAWDAALIEAGIPVILAATQDAFVPQMVNFELVGGVNFKKGCYPGQEIVARTQYRGILKRRMARAHVDGAAPKPGQPVYAATFGDQAAGQVVNALGGELLVCAQLESLAAGDLRLGAPDGPALAILSHPAAQAA